MGNIDFRTSLINTLEDIKGEYLDYQDKIYGMEGAEYDELWNEAQRKINALDDTMDELKKLNSIDKILG